MGKTQVKMSPENLQIDTRLQEVSLQSLTIVELNIE